MLPNEIMQSDMLDVLFEHRNKTYGAYPLRRNYNKRLLLALILTLFVAAIFSMLQLLHRDTDHTYARIVTIIDDPHFISLPPVQPQLQPPVTAPHSPAHFREVINSTPVIVSEEQPTTMPTIEDVTNSIMGNEITAGEITGGNLVAPQSNAGNVQTETATPIAPVADNSPLVTAEFMPEFPGGIEALRKFLLKNIRQPDDLQAGDKIVVLVSFVVSENGEIENEKVIRSGRDDLDKEVLRVIGKMPVWKPGRQNGHEVPVYFNLPVTFLGADGE